MYGNLTNTGGSTGIAHGVRLNSFNAIHGHANCIAPGKRPRITLSPTLVLKNGKPVIALSIPGADLQDQAALQIILAILDFGHGGKSAASLRRFYVGYQRGDEDRVNARRYRLRLPSSIDGTVRAELEKRGHAVTTTSTDVGGISMLTLDQDSRRLEFTGDAPGRSTRNHIATDL